MKNKGVKIDSVTAEDGTIYEVRFIRSDSMFTGQIDNSEFRESDLNEIKSKMLKCLEERHNITWKPIIKIEKEHWDGEAWIRFDRAFKGKKADGEIVFAHFEVTRVDGPADEYGILAEDEREEDDVIEGMPGSHTYAFEPTEERIVLPYTPERWTALVQIKRRLEILKNQLQEILTDKKQVDQFLTSVNQRGNNLFLLERKDNALTKRIVDAKK